jgi:UPF0716 protein FxsA
MRRLAFIALFVFPVLDVFVTREFARRLDSPMWMWLLGAALLGILLVRHEGLSFKARFMAALTAAAAQDTNPWRSVVNSGRKIAAGILLIVPGVLSDTLALAMLLVPLNVAARLVPAWVTTTRRGAMSPRTLDGSYRRVD